ncbi:concanavalin A-like lectin/glucanase-domain-containing protein [Sorangium cellulosum]|uniref:Concanavalin A-like lectin/glucanase-domain-containing protein n=1 Tax=Sorangium cellulosum TaxID=56 RepID=A0A2L0EMQ9_SORCE|nr:concanavalin A-like lectin/glucanase-domain-containing protein [Sorangium cellulosum]
MRLAPRLVSLSAAALTFAAAAGASAAPVWTGDFETGDLSQWSYKLNEQNISVVNTTVLQGRSAGQIRLTNDATWPNGIKRVELQHRPADARTAEGAETYFAWSIYLPEALAADPPTQIGYWESLNTYSQMMSFEVVGRDISFATRKPMNKVHWQGSGALTPGVWHRIAMHIQWSKNAGQGSVDVWFDGEQVVTAASAQTLNDDNPHITQVGLLRNPSEFTDSPILFLDDAVEGDSLEDIRPGLPSGEGGGGGAGGAGGTENTGGAGGEASGTTGTGTSVPATSTSTGTGTAASTGSTGQASSTGTGAGAPGEGEQTDEGCSCRAVGSPGAPAPGALAGLVIALAFARRRPRR